jgi:hypothetical protein
MCETAPSNLNNHLSGWLDFHIYIAELFAAQFNVALVKLLDKILLADGGQMEM